MEPRPAFCLCGEHTGFTQHGRLSLAKECQTGVPAGDKDSVHLSRGAPAGEKGPRVRMEGASSPSSGRPSPTLNPEVATWRSAAPPFLTAAPSFL